MIGNHIWSSKILGKIRQYIDLSYVFVYSARNLSPRLLSYERKEIASVTRSARVTLGT